MLLNSNLPFGVVEIITKISKPLSHVILKYISQPQKSPPGIQSDRQIFVCQSQSFFVCKFYEFKAEIRQKISWGQLP